jgi:hypothetical protein
MRRGAWIALLCLAALPCAVWVSLRLGLFTPLFNVLLSRELSAKTHLEVRVGSLRSDVLRFIEADDVVVLAPVQGARIPLLTIRNLRLEYELWQALRGRLDWQESLRLARVQGMKLFLLRESNGAWNLAPLAGAGGARSGRSGGGLPLLPASRVELEDSEIVFHDEVKGFHATMDRLQGSLDTRALPLLAFSLNGRTEGRTVENLSLAGEWNQADGSLYGRLNLEGVEMARYLNYFLPGKGLRFTAGTASLSVRMRKAAGGDMDASGRADLAGGTLELPGVDEPLSALNGALAFDQGSLRFREVQARFLGSSWIASGSILDLRHPSFDLAVSAPAVPLAALSEQVKGLGILQLTGTASVTATLQGPARSPAVQARLEIPALGIAGVELTGVSAGATLRGRRLTVRDLSGGIWGGHVHGDAQMDLAHEGGIKADMSVDGALLERALLRGQRPLPFDGLAHVHLVASGLLRSPTLALDLDVTRPSLGNLRLEGLTAHAELSPQGLESTFASPHGRLQGSLAFTRGPAAAFHDTKITLHQIDLSATAQGLGTAGGTLALPQAAADVGAALGGHLGGLLDAVFSLEGPLRAPTVWMQASLPQGRLFAGAGWPRMRSPTAGVELRLNGTLGFHGHDLMLGRNQVPFRAFLGPRRAGLEVQALGHYPVGKSGGNGHLALAVDLDMKLLDSLALFQKSQGRLNADVVLSGTDAAPLALGDVKVAGFSCVPGAYLAPVKDGHMTLMLHGQSVEVADLGFKAGGRLNAGGGLDFSGGLAGLKGQLKVETDADGLRFQNWEGMGSGSLVLDPLTLSLDGEDEPLDIAGNLRLSDALIVYAGRHKADDGGGAPPPDAPSRRPLSLDLHVGLGANVWYEKHQTKTLHFSDPTRWFSDTLASAEETLLQPDISFRMRPTEHDFIIRGTTPALDLRGELAVDRGRITIMENDFDINGDRGPALIRFEGQRADVSGTASANMRYTRDDPLTLRPRQKTVLVYVMISPRSDEELEESGLEGQFLNYKIDFDSDPQIITDNSDLQRTACIDLVMLGDPMVDVGEQGSATPGAGGSATDQGATLANSGMSTVVSGMARKELAEAVRYLKVMGANWIDVIRVTPRIRYQAIGPQTAPVPGSSGVGAAQPTANSGDFDIDWTAELGKSIGDKIYSSLQFMTFGQNARDSVVVDNDLSYTVQSYGARAGIEYQVSPSRTLEVYGNFGCDDNLDPVANTQPTNPRSWYQAPNTSFVVQLRNTMQTGNYGDSIARRRRWELETEGVP